MPQNIPKEFTDHEMVLLLRRGQPEVLSWLYDKYAPVLTGLATRIMGDKEKAEAVLQETFIAIWAKKDSYDATRLSLLSWMIILTRDITKAALKAGTYTGLRIESDEASNVMASADHRNTQAINKKVQELFCNLAPEERMALDLVYLKGYICADAAVELGISLETLKSRLQMAGKHLREVKI